MADKTQINLERIRACDAEWDESKHKRADNGQFTSGGGATVIKAQSGGKAKVQQLKNVVFPACAGVILLPHPPEPLLTGIPRMRGGDPTSCAAIVMGS